MRITWHLLAASLGLGCAVATANADGLLVSRATFAGGVENREPAPAIPAGEGAGAGPLWFWSEIQALPETLERLREEHRLPLQHRWYKNVAGIPGPDQRADFYRYLEEIDAPTIAGLTREADARGFFTYRTSSCRSFLRPGNWTVIVTDAKGARLSCLDGSSCRFDVTVHAGAGNADRCPPEP